MPKLEFDWLWSHVYRGLQISYGKRTVWIGWTRPSFKKKGW